MEPKHVNLYKLIRDCPNFPKPGVLFRDITPVYSNYQALNYIADEFENILKGNSFDVVVGIESRGFVVATLLALRFKKGLTMVRKAGKLPGDTIKKAYDIEYGSAIMEIQRDAISEGQKVLVVDDLIATGGTAQAAVELVIETGGKIAALAIVVELANLPGALRLRESGYTVHSLVVYQ
jgi:adenine phosphoribosyltransferase